MLFLFLKCMQKGDVPAQKQLNKLDGVNRTKRLPKCLNIWTLDSQVLQM